MPACKHWWIVNYMCKSMQREQKYRNKATNASQPIRHILVILLLLVGSTAFSQYPYQFAVLKYNGGGDYYANPTSVPNLAKFCNENLNMNVWINEYPIISEKANLISSFSNPNAKLYFEIYLFSDCTYWILNGLSDFWIKSNKLFIN